MGRAGVPECVGSVVRELYSQPSHECLNSRGKAIGRERMVRRSQSQEKLAANRSRSDLFEIPQDGCADLRRERVVLGFSLLGSPDVDAFSFPVEIIKG